MIYILVSLLCWFFIFYLNQFGKKVAVPYRIRGGGGGDVETNTYYAYQLSLPHQSLSPDKPIYCYDAYGELVYTVEPNNPHADYGLGLYSVPGTAQNTIIESISTAS